MSTAEPMHDAPSLENELPSDYRRNMLALTGDYVAFNVAMAFMDPSTVIPTFVSELTNSAPLIGLTSTLQSGGWLLPQLFAASYVSHRERKKPFIVWPAALGRPLLLVLSAATYFLGQDNRIALLIVLYLSYLGLWLSDGLASVPWFDVLAKAIPGRRRGRYLATSQVVGGVLAIGAGALVKRILDPHVGLVYPQNYALLFLLASVFMAASFVSLLMVREPVEPVAAKSRSIKAYLGALVGALRGDRRFALVVIGRLVAGFGSMATPFFILFGTDQLALGTGVIGLCVTAQVIGRVLGGLILGYTLERRGHRFTICSAVALTLAVPLLALLLGISAGNGLSPQLLYYAYPLIFLLLGISVNTLGWSYTNYVLDIAPPPQRTTYVGLANTVTGLLIVAPVLGGALLEASSYLVLFAVAVVIYALALALAWRLPPVGKRAA